MNKRVLVNILLPLLCLLWVEAAPGREHHDVRSILLYRFMQLSVWPDATQPLSHVTLCVMGKLDWRESLRDLERKRIDQLAIQVRDVTQQQGLRHCQVVLISATFPRAGAVLQHLKGSAVLTVGEGFHFSDVGGMLSFVKIKNKQRFLINKKYLNASGIVLRSQLFNFAYGIRD